MRLASFVLLAGLFGCSSSATHPGYLVYSATTALDAGGTDTAALLAVGPATATAAVASARPMNSIVVPYGLTVTSVNCEVQVAPGANKHTVLTVYNTGVAEAVSADISGSNKAASDLADTAVARAGEDLEVGLMYSGAAPGNILCTLAVQ